MKFGTLVRVANPVKTLLCFLLRHHLVATIRKKSARQDKQNWAESKAIQGEAYLATGQTEDAFAHFRNLRAACPRNVSPILDDHGNLMRDKVVKAHRWKNHFQQLLNHSSVLCPDLPSTVQEEEEEDQQACQEPPELEVHTAVRKQKNGKAPGLCGITAEMLKASGDLGILWLTSVIKQVWQTRVITTRLEEGHYSPYLQGKWQS